MFAHKKINTIFVAVLLFMGYFSVSLLMPNVAHAETIECANGAVREVTESDTSHGNVENLCASDGGVKAGATIQPGPPRNTQPTIGPNEQPKYVANDCNNADINQSNCGIVRYLVMFIKFLSAIVGVVIVASIIIGGIQYSVSADEANAVNAAKKRIFNAILALVVYIFMFALLQYLVPGGVL